MVRSPGRGAWLPANQHGLWTRRLGSPAAGPQLAFLRGPGAIFTSITWLLVVPNAAPAADCGSRHDHDRSCHCTIDCLATPLLLTGDRRRVPLCRRRSAVPLAAAKGR